MYGTSAYSRQINLLYRSSAEVRKQYLAVDFVLPTLPITPEPRSKLNCSSKPPQSCNLSVTHGMNLITI
jgi:hypothetical protein